MATEFQLKENYDVEDLKKLVTYLRSDKGCPWDREQTHASIRRDLLEEAYEVCEAIDQESLPHLKEELGDLLLQVVFHTSMEEDKGNFTLDDVADGICKKMVLRHPHVFGDVQVGGTDDVLTNWDVIKQQEKAQNTTTSVMDSVARSLPGLWRAEKIQKKAKKVGFDWDDVGGAMSKLWEEVQELQEGLDRNDIENIEEELGDIIFCVVNVARFYGMDCEAVTHKACEKFIRRFRFMEQGAAERGIELCEMNLEQMEEIYQIGRSQLEGKEIQHPFTARPVNHEKSK